MNHNSCLTEAAYVHIPFCRRRCYYCDFPVSLLGDRLRGEASGTIAEYLEVLCQEIHSTIPQGASLRTVFFGGGTPSLLSARQLERVLHSLDCQFGIFADTEIAIEMDPGTFDLEQLQGYGLAGVNRVSLGAQSFHQEQLQACGRTHTPEDIYKAVDLMHQAGLDNYSLDLISGLPHQTLTTWQQSLEAAVSCDPAHLSVYDLTVEPGTAFHRWYRPGESPLPTDEMTADMYRLAQATLSQAGYEHYEISNYARPGYQCRHNRVYWENRAYYGFGMGAASYVQGQRFSRPRKRREYRDWVEAGCVVDSPVTEAGDRWLDTLMLGLRLADGLSLGELATAFGKSRVENLLRILKPYMDKRWVMVWDRATGGQLSEDFDLSDFSAQTYSPTLRLRLTDPEGFLFSNVVLTRLFQAFESQ
jgi:oxygen-independent coproporphyrinogen-3 oxidase